MCEKEAQNILDFSQISQKLKSIGNFMVEEVTQGKQLGVIVSNNLKWEEHIQKLVAMLKIRLFSLKTF